MANLPLTNQIIAASHGQHSLVSTSFEGKNEKDIFQFSLKSKELIFLEIFPSSNTSIQNCPMLI